MILYIYEVIFKESIIDLGYIELDFSKSIYDAWITFNDSDYCEYLYKWCGLEKEVKESWLKETKENYSKKRVENNIIKD